nr:MAG TPA: hypothetical protein [Crassvirales sp.]
MTEAHSVSYNQRLPMFNNIIMTIYSVKYSINCSRKITINTKDPSNNHPIAGVIFILIFI